MDSCDNCFTESAVKGTRRNFGLEKCLREYSNLTHCLKEDSFPICSDLQFQTLQPESSPNFDAIFLGVKIGG